MKFSGANLMMGFSKILKNSKVSIVFLLIVIVLIIISFNYFNESNKIRVMEVDFENIVTENQLPIDTLELSIICNLSGDFQLKSTNMVSELLKIPKNGYSLYADYTVSDTTLAKASESFILQLPADSSEVKIFGNNIPYFDSISVYQTYKYKIDLKTPSKHNGDDDFNSNFLYRGSFYKGNCVIDNNVSYLNHTLYLYDKGYHNNGISINHYPRKITGFCILANKPRGLIYRNRNVSAINIKSLSIPNVKNVRIRLNYMTAMQFDALSIQPSYQTPNEIIYEGKETIDQICKSGLFVYGHSLSNGRSIEMSNFILATLIGFLLSLVVEILYKIVEKNNK